MSWPERVLWLERHAMFLTDVQREIISSALQRDDTTTALKHLRDWKKLRSQS